MVAEHHPTSTSTHLNVAGCFLIRLQNRLERIILRWAVRLERVAMLTHSRKLGAVSVKSVSDKTAATNGRMKILIGTLIRMLRFGAFCFDVCGFAAAANVQMERPGQPARQPDPYRSVVSGSEMVWAKSYPALWKIHKII